MPSTSSSSAIWALVDCNNFYASCEKLFRPDLASRPVVVLSNNDGCIISRSREAKEIGVPMGEPWFKLKHMLQANRAAVFSANFALYGDISNRIMDILENYWPHSEQYSIDEAFLRLDGGIRPNLQAFCRRLKERIRQWTGMTVSIGVGATPTLAKLANHIAKKYQQVHGLYSLVRHETEIDCWLARTPVDQIWGIGSRNGRRLKNLGINTALELKNAPDGWIKEKLTVTGLATVWELRGINCQQIPINCDLDRKNLLHSRSFGKRVHGFEELSQAVATFCARCAERLRMMELVAGGIWVRIRTSPHNGEFYAAQDSASLSIPTDDSGILIGEAKKILEKIYASGYPYAKATVMFFDLERKGQRQLCLFEDNSGKSANLMRTIDTINQRYGRLALRYGSMGLHAANWHMQQEMRSPDYTSRWQDLPVVMCR